MLTLSSWYPKIDLNESFYEDDSCQIGVNGQNYYLISKLDKTIIVYERSHPQKTRTFIDLVSVDSLRYNSFKRLYNELGENSGSGRSRFTAAEIRFRLENPTVQAEYVPSLTEMHRHEIDILKKAYQNDCCTHLSSDISWQIKLFMKYVHLYEIRIVDSKCVNDSGKMLIIIDENNELVYRAIIRDNILYFTNLIKEKPTQESFVKKYFQLSDYEHYESLSDVIIDIFKSDKLFIESRYDPIKKAYSIYCHRTISDGDTLTTSVEQKIISEHEYDVNFIFNFVFDSEFLCYPKEDFIERLRELSILAENERVTLEHIKVYEMTII